MSPPEDLRSRIQALLDGPVAAYLGEIPGGEPSERPLAELREASAVSGLATAWGERQGYDDPRVQVTQWSKFFWRAVLPPWGLAAWLGATVRLERCVMICRDDEPAALDFHAPVGEPLDPVTAFAPWVEAMAAAGRLSPRVIWANAGNLLQAMVEVLPELDPGLAVRASRLRRAWLEKRTHEGRRHPLFASVRWLPGAPPRRLRRICCVRYRDPALGYCATCPLEAAPASVSVRRSARRIADRGPPKNQVSSGNG
ncbi:siderophore-iron reductase FhuF [Arhodomonas sp. AD133]|uniref:siderophore-iron reductase FhuF n=1 Tax=Arhodomonas sp. AD133 TaxID=3415009 RepID=UPI003EBEC8D7